MTEQKRGMEARATGGSQRRVYQTPTPPVMPEFSTPPAPSPNVSAGAAPAKGQLTPLARVGMVGVVAAAVLALSVQVISPLKALARYPSYLAETWSPAYEKHRLAKPDTPLQLSSKDLDVEATRAAIAAARGHLPIPRVQAVTPLLLQALKKGEVEIYTIRAYDTCRVDGDWISIVTPNLMREGSFMIDHGGRLVSIPVIKGQKPQILLVADKDGVGGVTVGLQTSDGMWYSQVLPEGTVQTIPLEIR
jgi:hypothetical protein